MTTGHFWPQTHWVVYSAFTKAAAPSCMTHVTFLWTTRHRRLPPSLANPQKPIGNGGVKPVSEWHRHN
ncbi:hypothetical protein EYF80_045187 [Liparis tanakae]|uniref:Uncharacterized protein n=1 Tax=Liparis tanakae TaxID=230148 RepID=A0A4Z2FTP4_9TELE|nr:hypothetical protein EYF80_045187 [Liparis tanakae]